MIMETDIRSPWKTFPQNIDCPLYFDMVCAVEINCVKISHLVLSNIFIFKYYLEYFNRKNPTHLKIVSSVPSSWITEYLLGIGIIPASHSPRCQIS